jgi:hypothetical protein
MLAHIAGAPVEEAAISLAPIAAMVGSLAALRLQALARKLPAQVDRPRNRESPPEGRQ